MYTATERKQIFVTKLYIAYINFVIVQRTN